MAQPPAILLIPGSFAPAHLYSTFVDELHSSGYPNVVTVSLPSVGKHEGKPAATMAEDAEAIRSAAKELIQAGNDVLLVSHSYGGVPTTESLKGLNVKGKGDGEKGVVGLLYVTSIVPEVGQGGGSAMSAGLPDYLSVEGEYMTLEPTGNAKATFSDLPFEQGLALAKQMPNHSAISFAGELTYPGYKYVPVGYLLCEEDLTVPPEIQQRFIDLLEKESPGPVVVSKCKAGHVPHVSDPDAVVAAIGKIIEVFG